MALGLGMTEGKMDAEGNTLDDTQIAILEAVATCAAKYGFGGMTTRRIAQEAGVNEVTLFRRYGNKNALINAAFQREASFVKIHGIAYSGDVEADLRRLVGALVELGTRRSALLPVMLLELPHNEELRQAVGHPLQAMGEAVALVSRYQQEGKLSGESPLAAYIALIGPIMFTLLVGNIVPEAAAALDPTMLVRNFLDGHRA
jgi:AcrR family transcriptional regulator